MNLFRGGRWVSSHVPSVIKWSCCLGPGVSRWAQQERGTRSVGMSAMGWVWGTGRGDGKVSQTEKRCQGPRGPQGVRYTKVSEGRTDSGQRIHPGCREGTSLLRRLPQVPRPKKMVLAQAPGMGGKEIQTRTPPHPTRSPAQARLKRSVGGQL